MIVSVPVLAPTVVGENVTLIVQVPEGATVEQLLVWEKSPEMPMFEMMRFPEPVFVTVMACGAELVPTPVEPKVTDGGLSMMAAVGTTPVPVRATVCGDPGALSVTCTDAERTPPASGEKVTLIVQLAPPPKLPPQLLVWEKSPGFVPMRVMPEIVVTPFPLFVTVMSWEADVVPVFWFPNASVEGLKLRARNVPSPESVTTCGEPGPSSVNESVPDAEMAVCGVKVTLTVQVPLTASVFALIEK